MNWKILLLFILFQSSKKFSALILNSTSSEFDTLEEFPTNNVSTAENGTEFGIRDYYSDEFLSCIKIKILSIYFEILKNRTAYIPAYKNFTKNKGLYDPGNYYLDNDGIYICVPNITKVKDESEEIHQDKILDYITFIGLILSLFFLFLHFLAFLIVPEMKNLPGKNLASFAFSTFFAHLLFLVGRSKFSGTQICHPVGLIMYYFMMTSFFWMNAISFNIFRSFREATNKLRLPEISAQRRRFLCYSVYSWLTPAMFLCLVVISDETSWFPKHLRSGFNTNSSICWFKHGFPIFVFYFAPFAVLMVANVIFFIASAFLIFSNSMKYNGNNRGLKWKFVLYLKLTIIMGLVWVIGVIASLVKIDPLWYIFVILVTLQGFFIFLAFTKFNKLKAVFVGKFNWNLKFSITTFTMVQEDNHLKSVNDN